MGGLFYYSGTLFIAVPNAGWFAYTPLLLQYSPDLNLNFWVLGTRSPRWRAYRDRHQHPQVPGPRRCSRLPLFASGDARHGVHDHLRLHDLVVGSLLLELTRSFNYSSSSSRTRRQLAALAAPVLDLRAPGLVHLVLGRRGGVDDPAGVRPSATGRLRVGRSGLRRHRLHVVPRCGRTTCSPSGCRRWSPASSPPPASPSASPPASRNSLAGHCGPAGRCGRRRTSSGSSSRSSSAGSPGSWSPPRRSTCRPADFSYFVVGHLHYVLIGGVAFPIFAAASYWLPKFSGDCSTSVSASGTSG